MIIDKKKIIRQLRGGVRFIQNGARGTLEWCTGMGKTFIAIILIRKLQRKNPNRTAVVIVPTILLKNQWESELKDFKIKNVKVFVINSITLNNVSLKCDLLILDEIHRFASTEFSKIFMLVQFRFILGLTATIERLDGNHTLLVSHAPVVDTISLTEARSNKWISEYIEFNYGIHFSDEEQKLYDRLNNGYKKYFKMFNFDFDLVMKCQAPKSTTPGGIDGPTIRRSYAILMGWNPNSDPRDKSHLYHPDNIVGYAVQFGKYMRMRKELFYKSSSKVATAKLLANKFPLKTITFSESTEFADKISAIIPGSLSYHSYIPGRTDLVPCSKEFKTSKNADNFITKNTGKLESIRRDGNTVHWLRSVKISPTAVRREILENFENPAHGFNLLNTAKAVDQGFNVKDVELAIIYSRTSSPTQQIQRIGRAARKFTFKNGSDKVAMIINVYIKGKDGTPTQDEKWLRSAQKKNKNRIIWVDNLSEISLRAGIGHNAAIDEQEPE